ncbi:hypothetical protein BDW22DRAFT_347442 [Trametopsis cervina]|nr:hypothetical protein BDW22DRAFT_347442 [Trametopsis cervina]
MTSYPSSSARREQQQNTRVSPAAAAATTGDDDAKRKAVMNVVQVWLDRLQLISTITTFFAGIDGTILSFALNLTHATSIPQNQWSTTLNVMVASMVGSLIFHICAAITSFTASFILIRYRLIDMRDQLHTGGKSRPSNATDRTIAPSSPTIDKPQTARFESSPGQMQSSHSKDSTNATFSSHGAGFLQHNMSDILDFFQNITGTRSELEGRVFVHQVQPLHCFRTKPTNNGMHLHPPIHLLSRAHDLSVTMATLGFILALLGILAFAWTSLPLGVSAFLSACLGGCLFALFFVMSLC